jgi:hypothetical protein
MLETKKTMIYAGVAIMLALTAFFMAPQRITPDAFEDQGDLFFPEFIDPNSAGALEVIEYDAESGTARPFKVVNHNGNWTIPSHNDYPADGKERLAKTAAGVIGIKRDDFRTDNVTEHEAMGVIDPLDQTAGLVGRGQRVTLKDNDGLVLADFIIGHKVEGRDNMRFVRVPDQKRVYAARMDIDLSTKFEDWIETDLIRISADEISRIELKDYSINERTMSVEQRDNLILNMKDGGWKADKIRSGRMVDTSLMATMLTTLDELTIVGVHKKPDGLTASLTKGGENQSISSSDARSLRNKGFYFGRDGRLLSNEGELKVTVTDGVQYTLRFGEIVYGRGESSGDGTEGAGKEKSVVENRYLMITADFVNATFPEPPSPTNNEFIGKADSLMTEADRENQRRQIVHDDWYRDLESGRVATREANNRFAKWYYVISSDSYDKLRLSRDELIVKK